MTPTSSLFAILFAFCLLATACGSGAAEISLASPDRESAASQPADGDSSDGADSSAASQPADDGDGGDNRDANLDGDLPEGAIPVEPDGGIGDGDGDGAGPLPGAELVDDDSGTWHGAEVAVTNCPGQEWQRVQASAFSFSVPVGFVQADVQGIDSEVGFWNGGNGIEISFDYGWFSGSIAQTPGAENEPVVYSGIVGEQTIVRTSSPLQVGVLFEEVVQELESDQWNRLGLTVRFPDPNDEIIGRCVVGSIDWE